MGNYLNLVNDKWGNTWETKSDQETSVWERGKGKKEEGEGPSGALTQGKAFTPL